MDDYLLYSIIGGASIGAVSSTLVLIQLLLIKYKDYANFLVFLLVSTDLIMSVSIFLLIYPVNSLMCLVALVVANLSRNIHKILILYISLSMYSIIVKQNSITKKAFIILLIFGVSDGIVNCITSGLLFKPKLKSDYCYFSAINKYALVFNICFELLPDLVVLAIILFLYYHIRKTLKAEAVSNNLKCASNRIFAKRLIGYGLVFILYFIPFYVIFLVGFTNIAIDSGRLSYLWLCFFSWYPFFDSAIYGCTMSFKRNLFNVCFKSPEFDTEEDVMFYLRNENVLRPRFYLDMIGESERIAI